MMFTDWDIIRNLLLAARWTLLLSLTAFMGHSGDIAADVDAHEPLGGGWHVLYVAIPSYFSTPQGCSYFWRFSV